MFRSLFFIAFFLVSLAFGAGLEDAGRLYYSGRSEEALSAYRAIWAHGRTVDSALNAALIAAEIGKWDEAAAILEEALTQFPAEFQIQEQLAWILLNKGDLDRAEQFLKLADGSADPGFIYWLSKGRWASERGDFDASARFLRKALDLDPKSTLARYFLGNMYERKNDSSAAIAEYQRVLKEDSHFIEVRPLLGKLFEDKKNADEAWKQYARLYSADNKNPVAKDGMQRLASFISKKPEELVPPKIIAEHTAIPRFDRRDSPATIKVGIGTTSGGSPFMKNSLIFRTSTPFAVWDPDTRKDLRTGSAKMPWTIRYNSKQGIAEIVDSTGRVEGKFRSSIFIRPSGPDASTTIINSLAYAPNTSWGGLADKEIRGDIEIRVDGRHKSLIVINHLSIEEYLYGVLAAEMPVHWPMEALKAQAVIARTQALYRKGLHRKFGYDVCDEQHCQVYTGVGVESNKVREAVDGTRAEYLAYNGRAAHTVFSSNCGGVTQTGAQAGWGDVVYWASVFEGKKESARPQSLLELKRWLRSTPPAHCESSKYTWHPEYRWSRVVMANDIAHKIRRKKDVGRLKSVKIAARNGSGRVAAVHFEGERGSLTLKKEHEIRKYMGVGSIRSTFFVIDTVTKNGALHSLVIQGGGWGHGVGFCQSGAAGLAEEGTLYTDILTHYFPGTDLRRL